ncbi:MAG TPA: triose-phosphate isomerase [Gammaproteobacteria bacterium]|nr:triose-phosphate isomerase [Gammaproteobacteria bacterium]
MRQAFVAGNWKMHGNSASIHALVEGIKSQPGLGSAQVAVCPPFVYLQQVKDMLSGVAVALGAQNLCVRPGEGAYTGEVSGAMLADLACRYVIVGHSERRQYYGEDDALVAEKVLVAQAAGLTPIMCVGEMLNEREAGATEAVVARQLDALLDREGGVAALGQAVIAYEPVWAIGTGRTATPEQAQAVHACIRERIAARDSGIAAKIQILYGGSVKAGNAAELFAMPDIDGGLVGGASLDAEQFAAICRAAG